MKYFINITIQLLLLLIPAVINQPLTQRSYDILITGGRIIDGTGSPWYYSDIGIIGDRIIAIGDLKHATANIKIDASGLVVAPGFIDMLGQSEFNLLVDNRAASKLMQGVTTEITGEGGSIAPLSDSMVLKGGVRNGKTPFAQFGITPDWRTLHQYFERLEKRVHPAINIGTFVGAGGVRDCIIGRINRAPTPDELEQMKKLVAEAMLDGALGLSSSLQYVPDRFATTDELIELAKIASHYGGIYATHQRSEGDQILKSLDEVFSIARKADIPVEIFHLKVSNRGNWGKMKEVLKLIEAARKAGLDITANAYPYAASSNPLEASLPISAREGGLEKMLERLKDPVQRKRFKEEMIDPKVSWENQYYGAGGGKGIVLITVFNPNLKKYEGQTLEQIGAILKKDPRDVAMDIVIADRGLSRTVNFVMSEDDVRTVLKHPLISIGTDGSAKAEDGPLASSKVHPRAWGTFPRILGKYVREEKLLTLEEAIRKMTSQPAVRVGIEDRGMLRPGMLADITAFDPLTIRDVATFEDPNHYSTGVKYVLVNGRIVVDNGKITEERPGRVLRGKGYRAR